jgi:hypothetical protein
MIGGLISVLGRHLVEVIKLKAYAVALYAAAGLSLLFALGFALVALRNWFAYDLQWPDPDLWVALFMVVITAILAGVGVMMQRRQPQTQPAADIALLAGPPAASFAFRRLSPRTVAVGVVLIAGLFLGRRLSHRST